MRSPLVRATRGRAPRSSTLGQPHGKLPSRRTGAANRAPPGSAEPPARAPPPPPRYTPGMDVEWRLFLPLLGVLVLSLLLTGPGMWSDAWGWGWFRKRRRRDGGRPL